MKKNTTRRALILSVLSLVLCVSMLVGTTFAWFTDTVSSTGNKIQSGTLKIDLELLTEKDDGSYKWESIKDDKTALFDYNLWEPGYTAVRMLKVENEGNLALKWKATVSSFEELSILADVIDVYVLPSADELSYPADRADLTGWTKVGTVRQFATTLSATTYGKLMPKGEEGSVAYLGLALKMREEAGNEYQNKTIGAFDITIVASQLMHENDSFGPTYDKDATYPSVSSPDAEIGSYDGFNVATNEFNASSVSGNAALEQQIAQKGATSISLKVTPPIVDGNTVNFAEVGLYDQNGNKIDLTGNTEPMNVRLFVGTEFAGKTVSVAHSGALIATATVDESGYVEYTATHFCPVTVTVLESVVAPSVGNNVTIVTPDGNIVSSDKADEALKALDPTALVSILVGKNFYTVSAGMADSWYENPAIKGQVQADIYLPEDLFAYSMMYKNGDLDADRAGNGSHSDLALKADLDFAGKTWEPIGRFFTNIHGSGKTISNLSDSLFGCVYDCQLYNVTLKNVTASGSAAGIIAGELAGDVFIENVTIAGENKVTYAADSKDNWPEEGYGVGAICGVSLIGYSGQGKVDITLTGSITVDYGTGLIFRNNTNLENLGVTAEFGLNVYKANANVNVDVTNGKIITVGGYELEIANGLTLDTAGDYRIYNANGLKKVAEMVNSAVPYAATPFDNATVYLMSDIDLGGAEWIPIGDDRFQRTEFHGTFDGQGYTVSNLKITKKTDRDDENKSSYGLFGNVKGTVKNLTVDNAFISGAPKFIGALVGRLNGGLIDNCHVINSEVLCKNWTIGGVVGQYNEGDITNCTVKNTKITGYAAVGAIAGIALNEGERKITGCTVENCTLVQNGSYGDGWDDMFGTIIGSVHTETLTVIVNNCTASGNTIKGAAADTFVGYVEEGAKLIVDGYEYLSDGLFKNGVSYNVSNANGLATLHSMMVDKTAGRNIVMNLTADIDFATKTWTPVDSHADTAFSIKEINGNGHTLYNLTVDGQAMFSRFAGDGNVTVVVKDITFDGAEVDSNGKINTSILTVQAYQNVILDNVDVTNSTITGGYKVAPLIATVYDEKDTARKAILKNCDVSDTVVTATSYDFCTTGMVAFVSATSNETVEFENCTVTNVELYAPNVYQAHAAVYTTGSETVFNEVEGVTVTNVTFKNI